MVVPVTGMERFCYCSGLSAVLCLASVVGVPDRVARCPCRLGTSSRYRAHRGSPVRTVRGHVRFYSVHGRSDRTPESFNACATWMTFADCAPIVPLASEFDGLRTRKKTQCRYGTKYSLLHLHFSIVDSVQSWSV